MTSERFAQLIVSDNVVKRIETYRRNLPEIERLEQRISELRTLIDANPDPKAAMNVEMKSEKKQLQAQIRKLKASKTSLPALVFQATFDETPSAKGFMGRWRKQGAARLNGLYMLDVDHVDDIDQQLRDINTRHECLKISDTCKKLNILLCHVTPSGRGLRFVAVADVERGNIADNQRWLAEQLGVTLDEACKDASRCSFCPSFNDIKYCDYDRLFTYENEEFNKRYGEAYRRGNSGGSAGHAPVVSHGNAQHDDNALNTNELPKYHGIEYSKIISQWLRDVWHGAPTVGDRHRCLLSMAADFRYITDNNAELLARVLRESPVGQQIADEGGEKEIADIASGACGRQMWRSIPKRFQPVLDAAGVQLAAETDDVKTEKRNTVDYESWWQRLQPLLSDSPGLREAVEPLPDHHKMAGVLAAGAMFGTYLSRCWWEHFDGKDYRLSFLVYIIGSAASGKSFVTTMDKYIMEPMVAADRIGREWERQYKEEMKKRAASSKNAKAEAPEQQHPVIRYVPSTISNAMLYRRLTDAIDNDAIGPDGQPMHLHCYTCEAELATALRAQTGSWAGKLDLECKSFQNEVAGVDYANDQSVNGIIQVNWNQVITGTPDALGRKIRQSTVLDGLVTRLCLFPMPANDFAMIERRRAVRNHEAECTLRSLGIRLDEVKGELKCEKLVDYCYDYEKELADEARENNDLCLDYFRKRIPLIMIRYTLVRMVLRQLSQVLKGEALKVEQSDLDFAKLIGDFCLMSQMHFFGEMVMKALSDESEKFISRQRKDKTMVQFSKMPAQFTSNDVCTILGLDKKQSLNRIDYWIQVGLIKKKNKTFIKLTKNADV